MQNGTDGRVFAYQHHDGKSGALVELVCETDFAASRPELEEFGHDLCLHITAMKPRCIDREAAEAAGYELFDCLLEQRWFKDTDLEVGAILRILSEEVGERVEVRRFSRLTVGEGR